MKSRSLATIGLLVFVSASVTLSAGKTPVANSKSEVDLKKLLPQWASKAKRSVKDLGIYPLPQAKLASQYMGLVDDQVLDLLGDPLDREGEMDAYLKLQLLTFKPDLGKATDKQLMAIAANLPRLFVRKDPPKPFMKIFDDGTKRVLSEKGIKMAIDKYNSLFDSKNVKNVEYRNTIIGRLPREGGLRLFASMNDLSQRYLANEATCKSGECRTRTKDEAFYCWEQRMPIPGAMRKKLLHMLEDLKKKSDSDRMRDRVTLVELEKNGKVKIDRIHEILNNDEYNDLKQYLTGYKPK